MNPILTTILTTTVSSIVGISIGFIYSNLQCKIKDSSDREDKEKHDIDLLKSSMYSIMRNTLKNEFEIYSKKGWCDTNTKDTLTDMYNNYHKLGGNSFITDLYTKVMNLPTEKVTKKKGD